MNSINWKSKIKYSGITIVGLIIGLYLQTFGIKGASLFLASGTPTAFYWYENRERFSDKKVKRKFDVGIGALAISFILVAFLSMLTYSF